MESAHRPWPPSACLAKTRANRELWHGFYASLWSYPAFLHQEESTPLPFYKKNEQRCDSGSQNFFEICLVQILKIKIISFAGFHIFFKKMWNLDCSISSCWNGTREQTGYVGISTFIRDSYFLIFWVPWSHFEGEFSSSTMRDNQNMDDMWSCVNQSENQFWCSLTQI